MGGIWGRADEEVFAPELLNFFGTDRLFFFLSPQLAAGDAIWASPEPFSFPPFFLLAS